MQRQPEHRVDLAAGEGPDMRGGIVTFRNGVSFYSMIVGPDDDGDVEVRLSHAEYMGFTRDGKRCEIGLIDGRKRWVRNPNAKNDPLDVVAFERCSHKVADERGMTADDYYAARDGHRT